MNAIWLLVGALVGWVSVLTQIWTVSWLRPGASLYAVLWVVGGAFARWALAAGLLIAALGTGTGAGLLAFVGLWAARWWLVYRLHARS